MNARVGLLLAIVCCIAPFARSASAQPARRPNVIIILADDLGYSDLGCFGGEVQTPNLDALAAGGVRFTSFYNNSRCCPSRASILTGLYAHQAGVGGMTDKTSSPAYSGRIKPTVPTIAEVLKANGYRTAIFGKWHVANHVVGPEHAEALNRERFPDVFSPIEQYPTRRGFDDFYGTLWGVVNFFNPYSLVDGETPVKELPADFYITDALNDRAASYIKSNAESSQPFFMYLAHNAPHWPLHARAEDVEKYRGHYTSGWDAVRDARYRRMSDMGLIDSKTTAISPPVGQAKWDRLSSEEKRFQAGLFQAHAAMIDRMDQGLGRVFQALKDARQWENTLIVFLSDNGASPERYENPGFDRVTIARDGRPIEYRYNDFSKLAGPEHTWFYIGADWAHVANTPYRKAKASQYSGGQRTPLIAHWPAGLKAPGGSFVRARGHVIDLMPTVLDVAGAKMPESFDGQTPHALQGGSLRPLCDGAPDRPDYPVLFGEHEGGRSVIATDGWKLLRDRGEKAWRLYDLNTDQTEMRDRIAEQPERAAKMEAMWNEWAKANDVLPKP